ncbi:MAG: MFS transporter [Chloroflexi bacterium]|nr:MFS transporter [Chloroflexota bacterium]
MRSRKCATAMMYTNTITSRFFRSFQQRNYRLLWFSDGVTSSAEQMEFLVLVWFVATRTESAFLVTLYGALRFTGTLFAPFYGIIVDRYDRLMLLRISRIIFTVIALIIAALSFLGLIQIWHIFVLTGVAGMVRAFDNVTRQTLMADMVPRHNLGNAIALTRTGRDTTQIVSPVIGGFLLDSFGLGWAYVAIIALLIGGTALTIPVKPPPRFPATRGEPIFVTLVESFRYARSHQVVLALLLLAFLVNLTGFPLNQGLVPVFARDVLLTDSTGLGWLLGAYSAGAFIGSIVIAGIGDMERAGRLMSLGSVGWHAAIVVLAASTLFNVSLGVLALAGLVQSFTMVTMSILLLVSTPTEMRGRMLGLRSLAVYGLPLGLLASGAIADTVGITFALIGNGVIGIAITVAIVLALRGIWRA